MKIFTGSLLLVLLYPLGMFFGGIRGEISALSSRTDGYQLKAVANIAIPSAETPSPAANDYPTPTLLPRNPAVVTAQDVSDSILLGGLSVLLVFSCLGGYLWIKRER